jgi:peptidoglycan/xylan/chitin deacetylase (PgdA/CDA1 family)
MLPVLREEKMQCLFFVTGASLRDEPAMLWYIELYLMMREARQGPSVDWRGIQVQAMQTDAEGKRAHWLRLMNELSRFDGEERAEFLADAVDWWGLDRAWKKNCLADPLLRQRFQLLGAAQLRQLADSGMSIGAHTLSHPVLSQQPDEFARREIVDSKRKLEEAVGEDVWALAYPYGNPAAVGPREFMFAKEAGYSCAFMNIPGNLVGARKYSLPRVHITADMSRGVFEANVSGFHDALRRRLRPSEMSADIQISAQ